MPVPTAASPRRPGSRAGASGSTRRAPRSIRLPIHPTKSAKATASTCPGSHATMREPSCPPTRMPGASSQTRCHCTAPLR